MLFPQGILGASFVWITILNQEEFRSNELPEKCGKRPDLQTAAGGYTERKKEAEEHAWPWHVGVYTSAFGTYPFCGGTLISPKWVLTAAHCVIMALGYNNATLGQPFSYHEITGSAMTVFIGAHDFTRQDGAAYRILVEHVIMHPNFPLDGPKTGFDIALLKLTRAVRPSAQAAFACLPDPGFKLPTGHVCYVAGWGLIANPPKKPSQQQPEVLMEKPARIAPVSGCKKVFSSFKARAHVCTKQAFGTSCVGDSGGGLHCPTRDGRWTVYGVASFASPDCAGKFYGCVKTDSVLSWIKETIVIAT
ncbi:hypothetical protein SprV_0502025100 [Sparganum proliferum]